MLNRCRIIFMLSFCLCASGLFLFMPAIQPAYACAPTSTPEGGGGPTEIPREISAAQESQLANAIVEGTVLDFKSEDQSGVVLTDVVFQVDQYDKGQGPQIIRLAGSFSLFCPMGPPFDRGSKLVLLLSQQPTVAGEFAVIDWFGAYDGEVLASIRSAAGEKPHAPDATAVGQKPYVLSTVMPTETVVYPSNQIIMIGVVIVILIVVVLAGLGIWWVNKPPSTKSK